MIRSRVRLERLTEGLRRLGTFRVLVADDHRLAFSQVCGYPDGAKVFCLAMVELKSGKIAHQTMVQAWDE